MDSVFDIVSNSAGNAEEEPEKMSPALITDRRPSVQQSSVVDENAFAGHRADAYGMIGIYRLEVGLKSLQNPGLLFVVAIEQQPWLVIHEVASGEPADKRFQKEFLIRAMRVHVRVADH